MTATTTSSQGGDSDHNEASRSPPAPVPLMQIQIPPEEQHWTQIVENGMQSSSSTTTAASTRTSNSRKHHNDVDATHVIQVANIAPQATRDQMHALFGYLGKIEDVRLYPTMDIAMQYTSKICFVKYRDSACVGVAQHLTNTVFVDRALIVIPYIDGDVPDEAKGLELLNSGSILPGIADPKLPQHVSNQLEGIPPQQVVVTKDPKLDEFELPSYPNLPPTLDSRRIEEIRRTVMVANVDPDMAAPDLMEYFATNAGEVKYLRLCSRDNDPLQYAMVEFTEQPSVLGALKCNGNLIGSKHIKVYHSTQAIVKPQAKTNEAAQKEIEEAMTRQAQNLLNQGLDSNGTVKEKRRSRSVSRGRIPRAIPRRSRTRSRSPRRRSGSRSRRRRSRSRSPRRSRRSRSRSRGRVLRSPRRHRSRSKSRDKKRSTSRTRRSKRSGSRDRDRERDRRRDRDREKEKEKEKKPKKDKERDRDRRSRDRDTDGKDKGKENGKSEEPPVEVEVEKERDREKDRERKKEKRRSKSGSKSPSREKRRSSSRDKKKRSKSKKKKRDDSDRDDSVDNRSSRSRNVSVDGEPQPMDTE